MLLVLLFSLFYNVLNLFFQKGVEFIQLLLKSFEFIDSVSVDVVASE